jgi:hypothetical protein
MAILAMLTDIQIQCILFQIDIKNEDQHGNNSAARLNDVVLTGKILFN